MAKSSDIKKLALGALALSAFTVPIFRSGGRTGLTFVSWLVNHTIFGPPVEYVPEEDYTRELEGVEMHKQLPSGSQLEKAMSYYQISEPSARELLSHPAQLKISSPAIVVEGESYLVRLTITNLSTKLDVPVEATLGIGISAATEWVSLIPAQVSGEYFLANETRIFEYTMNVPMGSGGQSGSVSAWVEDPTGIVLASASEGVVIIAVTPPATVLAGRILDTKWRETGTEEWHSLPLSVPGHTDVDIKWRVRNDSNGRATFTMGAISLGRYRLYPETLTTLDPGEEADLIRERFSGRSSGTVGEMTFHLAALAGEVISTYQPDWYDADLVDSVTIQYDWY